MSVLDLPYIRQTRRNHALEHATIHVLSERIKPLRLAGRSQPNGFYLYGDVPTDRVELAIGEAIRRMLAGEHQLAVHPGCGTNLVTSGLLSGGLAFLFSLFAGKSARWYDRLPNAALGGVAGVAMARPLGPWLQAHVTTSADMRGMQVKRITRRVMGRMTVHFVETLQ